MPSYLWLYKRDKSCCWRLINNEYQHASLEMVLTWKNLYKYFCLLTFNQDMFSDILHHSYISFCYKAFERWAWRYEPIRLNELRTIKKLHTFFSDIYFIQNNYAQELVQIQSFIAIRQLSALANPPQLLVDNPNDAYHPPTIPNADHFWYIGCDQINLLSSVYVAAMTTSSLKYSVCKLGEEIVILWLPASPTRIGNFNSKISQLFNTFTLFVIQS